MPDAKTEALFPNLRDAINLLNSPLFHDFVALVAAFRTPGKDDDKAAFSAILKDAGLPEMADLVDPLYDLVLAIIGSLGTQEAKIFPMAGPEKFFGPKKSRFHPCIRIRAARQYAKENGGSIGAALLLIRQKITDEQIDGFALKAGVTVGAIGDGHILQWIVDHGPEIMAIIKLILAALMAA